MSILDYDLTFTDEEFNEILQQLEMGITDGGSGYGTDNWGWEYDGWTDEEPTTDSNRFCFHEWVPVLLINSTVYHCKKCGMKKEDYEKK